MAKYSDFVSRSKRWVGLETTDEYARRTLRDAAGSLGLEGEVALNAVVLELDAQDANVDSVIANVKRGDVASLENIGSGDFGGDSDIVRVLKIMDGDGNIRLLALLDPFELFQDPVGIAVSDPL